LAAIFNRVATEVRLLPAFPAVCVQWSGPLVNTLIWWSKCLSFLAGHDLTPRNFNSSRESLRFGLGVGDSHGVGERLGIGESVRIWDSAREHTEDQGAKGAGEKEELHIGDDMYIVR